MGKFIRYDGSVLPFAINATGYNRTIFGDTAQSNDINDNLNSNFLLGWEIVGPNEAPTKQDFNALGYTTTYLISYLYQQGIPEWNVNQEYFVNNYAVGSDGALYKSLTGDEVTPNKGNDPTTDTNNWVKVADFSDAEILQKVENATSSSDIEFKSDATGVILIDRSDNTKKYRLFVDDGNLGIEEV